MRRIHALWGVPWLRRISRLRRIPGLWCIPWLWCISSLRRRGCLRRHDGGKRGIARVEMNRINGSLDLFGARFDPVKIIHGDAEIHGFRFGSAAYLTDFSEIPPESMERLRGLDVLFLDALRHRPHPTHSTVENSLRLVRELEPRRAFFTHISHDLAHEETNRNLPENVKLAHDGLKLEFDIA